MNELDLHDANKITRQAWNENAVHWDARMGDEGNDFVNVLIWPSTERLLALAPGERVLDIACGTGLYSRRLAALGADVVAFDFSAEQIRFARSRTKEYAGRIDYRILDATNETELLQLGERQYDAAVCQMALFDMAEIDPLFGALSRLLRPGGRFLFSVTHPSFNNPRAIRVAQEEDKNGKLVTTYSVKVESYMTPAVARVAAIPDQPTSHLDFHRPLHVLLGAAFQNGFYLDALDERAFPKDHPPGRRPLSWGPNFSEFPPVLIAHMRLSRKE